MKIKLNEIGLVVVSSLVAALVFAVVWLPAGAHPVEPVSGDKTDLAVVDEPDTDGDGIPDGIDNCPDDPNPDQTNSDSMRNFGDQVVISAALDFPRSVFAADLDGDEDVDLLSASYGDDTIAWYENVTGAGDFGPQRIIGNAALGASAVFAADLDGDGDQDALSASSLDDTIAWYENLDGLGNFGRSRSISRNADHATAVFAADLDGDGDADVLSASFDDDKIAWYENLYGAGYFGPERIISTKANGAVSVFAADVDGDGDMDALSASMYDLTISWYENRDGAGSFGAELEISREANRPRCVFADDMDGDGDTDVLSASVSDDKIAWYENLDGAGVFGPQRVISVDAREARAVFTVDIEGDGDADVLSASFRDSKIALYENLDGAGNFAPQQTLSTEAHGASSVVAADVDGDGDPDVVSVSVSDGKLALYENRDDAFGDVCDNCPNVVNNDQLDEVHPNGIGDACEDPDGDAVVDRMDNCPDDDNPDQTDADEDGVGDVCDSCPADDANDIDGDRVCGDVDNCPLTANKQQLDKDSDGAGDVCDECPKDADDDADSDGLCADVDDCPVDSSNDIDGDGHCAEVDNCPRTANRRQYDRDSDGAGDVCDSCPNDADNDADGDGLCADADDCPIDGANDIDGDGHCGDVDNCPLTHNPDQADFDADGMGDICDACPNDPANDADLDGFCANVDNCPAAANPGQSDDDGDGVGDLCDNCLASVDPDQTDADSDAWGNVCDNCSYRANPDQSDLDEDGIGDVCDNCRNDTNPDQEDDDGAGNFGPRQVIPTDVGNPDRVLFNTPAVADDLDGDGDVDVVSAWSSEWLGCDWMTGHCGVVVVSRLAWHENVDGKEFSPQDHVIVHSWQQCTSYYGCYPDEAVEIVVSAVVGDVDGDGDADIVSVSAGYESYCSWDWWYSFCYGYFGGSSALIWWQNNGEGRFERQSAISESAYWSRHPVSLADVDGDDDLDVLSTERDKLVWYENRDGGGEFGGPQVISSKAGSSTQISTADVDGDGDTDVLFSDYGEGIRWNENMNGLGNFGASHLISSDNAYSVAAADVDDDGDVDVLFSAPYDGEIGWHKNIDGFGNFGESRLISSDVAFSIAAADVDDDGDTDVLAGGAWYDNVDGFGSFGPPQVISPQFSGSFTTADIDGNGYTDMISSRPLAWYANGRDGVGDTCDNCPHESNYDQADEVHPNGIGDACDDPDGDGVNDSRDNCADAANVDQVDADGDQVGDACDACPYDADDDIDRDGACGDVDNCPLTVNPDQLDTDTDGVGDICDNCWNADNPDQTDTDQDGSGDACDPCTDTDRDGFGNPGFPANLCPVDNCPDFQFHDQTDSDGDGVGDACTPPEISVSLSPNVIWPPDHRMVPIRAHVVATSPLGPPIIRLGSITFDESSNGQGDGDTQGDVLNANRGTADFDFLLRAERSGTGDGRTYTVNYTATTTNGSNVTTTGSATVVVSHDQGLSVQPDPIPIERANADTVEGGGN